MLSWKKCDNQNADQQIRLGVQVFKNEYIKISFASSLFFNGINLYQLPGVCGDVVGSFKKGVVSIVVIEQGIAFFIRQALSGTASSVAKTERVMSYSVITREGE